MLFLWYRGVADNNVFTTTESTLTAIGQVLGFIGIVLFALNLIISARFIWLEGLFGGLNRLYIQHSRYGQWAFIALLFHPLLLVFQYSGGSFVLAIKFLLPSDNVPLTFGIIGLYSMIALIALTLYIRPHYHLWKWLHKLFGVAFFFGGLHVLLIPSSLSQYAPLKIYILTIVVLGLSAYVYRSLLAQFFVRQYRYTVLSVTPLNNMITRVLLKPVAQPMNHRAGQFLFIRFIDHDVSAEAHPFSIVSEPGAEFLEIAVKNSGDYTARLNQLSAGSEAFLEGPFGYFFVPNGAVQKQVWVAGGIGITPFMGRVRLMAQSGLSEGESIDFYYCVRNSTETVYLDELRALEQLFPGRFRVIVFASDTEGRITAETIAERSGGLTETDVFMCAPPAMIHSLKKQFRAIGVSKAALHSEEFSL